MQHYDQSLVRDCVTHVRYWPRVAKVIASKVLARTSLVVEADGVKLEGGTKNGQGLWCLVAGLDYDLQLRAWLNALNPGDTVIDIGANIGVYTIRSAMRVGPTGRVIALEPLPTTADRLRRNIARNKVTNTMVIEAGIADRDGEAFLYEHGRQSSASICGDSAGPRYRVQVRTVDSLVKELALSRVDWIKVDIEGAEPMALIGMKNTIQQFAPRMLVENNASAADSIAILRSHKYAIGQYDCSQKWRDSEVGDNLFARLDDHVVV